MTVLVGYDIASSQNSELNNNLLNDRISVNGELVTLWKLSGCGLF